MNLDDLAHLKAVDVDNMLRHVDGLPEQFEAAWEHAQRQPLSDHLHSVRQVVITGMGGSAIGGDLLAAVMALSSPVQATVVRGYDLPAWARPEQTVVIASSFSGNTEETLGVYQAAQARGVPVVALTTGGKLAAQAVAAKQTVWTFSTDITQPRAAIGWSFGLLLGLAARAGWLGDLGGEVAAAVATLQKFREQYRPEVPAIQNAPKRQAGQLMGRVPLVIGGGIFEPVARRWKTQLNENSKMLAVWEPMPEMNHNVVVGIEFPDEVLRKLSVMFIASPRFDHPRVALRHELTANLFLQNGIMVDRFVPVGDSALAQMMHAIQFGDYLSYYAAIAHNADPMVIWPIVELKEALAEHG